MKPEVLSFDAAGTLIEVHWDPGRFAVECAQALRWPIDAQVGKERYERLLGSRWRDYCSLNELKNDDLCDTFWLELARDWIESLELPGEACELFELGKQGLYGENQRIFRLYADTLPALQRLRSAGYRMVVLSNWDYSLHRVLRILGVEEFFEVTIASLQEGMEKPDPVLFRFVSHHVCVPPDRIVHIGDDPIDDLQGARGAGLGAILLDRSLPRAKRPIISSLEDLPKALEWLD